jgi:hypothetical protein
MVVSPFAIVGRCKYGVRQGAEEFFHCHQSEWRPVI